jgi:hypothetical protein
MSTPVKLPVNMAVKTYRTGLDQDRAHKMTPLNHFPRHMRSDFDHYALAGQFDDC